MTVILLILKLIGILLLSVLALGLLILLLVLFVPVRSQRTQTYVACKLAFTSCHVWGRHASGAELHVCPYFWN